MSAEWNVSDRDYELLSAYLDGGLAVAERQALERRLAAEPQLRDELAALRETVSLLHQLPPLKAPRNFTLTPAMVGQRVTPRRGVLSIVTSPAFSAVTAAAAVFVMLLGVFLTVQTGGMSQSVAPIAMQVTGAASLMSPANTGDVTTERSLDTVGSTSNQGVPLGGMGGDAAKSTTDAPPTSPTPPPEMDIATTASAPGVLAASAPQSQGTVEEINAADSGAGAGAPSMAFAVPAGTQAGEQIFNTYAVTETPEAAAADSNFAAASLAQPPEPGNRQETNVASLPTAAAMLTLPPTSTPLPTFAPPTVSPIPAVTENQAQTNATDALRGDGFLQEESPAPADDAATVVTSLPELPVNVILLGVGILLLIVAGITTFIRRRS
ncbi:MAG: hypothetical protein K8I60_14095 [Anaerolineae bacterium]|nr:hypothetical protein [Anaerolineae bacterium]